jgi:hypothetical protein
MQRLIANILCILAVIFVPLWACLSVSLLVTVFFGYAEILCYFALADVMYSVGGTMIYSHSHLLLGTIVYLVMVKVRPYIKMY